MTHFKPLYNCMLQYVNLEEGKLGWHISCDVCHDPIGFARWRRAVDALLKNLTSPEPGCEGM